jgi:site-specific DNA recombinase
MLVRDNTTLHSVTETITEDPQGQLMETMLAGFAQFENEIRKQRCTSGMRGSLQKGLYIWDSKFGYKRPKKSTKRVTEPDIFDEPRASLLRKGMRLYAEGNTSISELEVLSEQWGLLSRTGKPLRKQRWSEILEDPYYAGILTDPWNGATYQGAHEPLISTETYNKIQEVKNRFGKNKQPRTQKNELFPLRNFVHCAACGHKLTGSRSRGRNGYHAYYYCKNKACTHYVKSIKKSVLEEAFIHYLEHITPLPEYIELFNAMVMRTWETRLQEVTTQRDTHNERISALQTRLARINEMRADGDIDKETYKEMRKGVEIQLASLETSQTESNIERLELEARLDYARNNISNLARIWQDVEIDQQIKLQWAVLPEGISYDKTNGRFRTAHLSYLFRLFLTFPLKESVLVAGPGIEPGPGGYEPPELPLLYPAI